MGSWYIIVTKLFEQFRMMGQSKDMTKKFWSTGSVQEGVGSLSANSPYRFIAQSALDATEHHEGGALLKQIDLHSWVTMSIQRAVDNVQNRLQDGLAFL